MMMVMLAVTLEVMRTCSSPPSQASEIFFFSELPQLQSLSLCLAGILRITGSAGQKESNPREELSEGGSSAFGKQ